MALPQPVKVQIPEDYMEWLKDGDLGTGPTTYPLMDYKTSNIHRLKWKDQGDLLSESYTSSIC